jgi:hypothetical protein
MNRNTRVDVAATATTKAELPLSGPMLLGVFERPSGDIALVRRADRRVIRVKPGDSLDGMTVTAIGGAALHLAGGGREEVLTIPGG